MGKLQRVVELGRHFGPAGVADAAGMAVDRVVRGGRAHSQPHYLVVETTTRCNLRCPFCQRSIEQQIAGRNRDLTAAEMAGILDQFPLLEWLVVQGIGEPLLNRELPDIVRLAKGRGLKVEFNTNGTLLTEETCRAIAAAGTDLVSVSVDSVSEAEYLKLRPGSTLARLTEGVGNLATAAQAAGNPRVMLRTVATRTGAAEFPAIVAWGRALGVHAFVLQDLLICDAAFAAERIDRAEFDRLRDWASTQDGATVQFVNFDRFRRRRAKRAHCCEPWEHPYITAEGYLVPCCTIGDATKLNFGNVFERPFAELWNSEAFRAFRAGFDRVMPAVCRGCPKY